jgi:hypothetical protein
MRCKVLDSGALRRRFHHVPDRLGCDAIAPDLAQPTYSPEDRPTVDASRRGPLIDCAFRPHWNRNRTDVLSFANQIGDHPVFFADLEIGTDHFDWPPEEYPAGEFATRAEAEAKKAEIEKTLESGDHIVSLLIINVVPVNRNL